ncbi:MAG: putative enzyme related to lactoylglutathione lyase [Alloalcanivorax sp.]|jgi:predicted enzyme related to lactoylglutathione lyase
MKVHYLEIVSKDVDGTCTAYEAAQSVKFGEPDEMLGGARTCTLGDGSIVGVRKPLRSTEEPVVRAYWLVDDIEQAVANVEAQGAEIAMPPMEIPGKGRFAIYILGGNDHGFWQL